jgi:hypothetical protein
LAVITGPAYGFSADVDVSGFFLLVSFEVLAVVRLLLLFEDPQPLQANITDLVA